MTEISQATWVVAYRDLLNVVSDRFRMLATLAFPLLFLLIFGASFANVVGRMAGVVQPFEHWIMLSSPAANGHGMLIDVLADARVHPPSAFYQTLPDEEHMGEYALSHAASHRHLATGLQP